MKLNTLVILAAGAGLFLLAVPVLAHHSFMVEYDMNKPVTIKGVVTKVEYANPHISFYVDITDEAGRVTNWGFEAGSPTALRVSGWTRDLIKAGDSITIDAFRARNGTAFAAAKTVTLADGRQFGVASDGVPPRK
jgi:DNA/RNA endonuclease YhcR with UshA esterase domain